MLLSIQNITKTYGNGVKAINHISLNMGAGMFGLLGPNGAGKSSLMRTIATLQLPDQGKIHFNDLDIFLHKTEFRKQLGYLPQDFGVYPKESAYSLLNYFAVLKGISSKKLRAKAIDQVLELTNLLEAKKKRVSTFSGGMLQRFGIAQLLLNNPKIIIVDEPTAGLDPAERTRFLNVLRNIGSENMVIFSTHLVEDVKALCQDMAIMDRGRLCVQANPRQAIESLQGKVWETEMSENELKELKVECVILSEHYNDKHQLVLRIFSEQPDPRGLSPVSPRLEDFYFHTLKTNGK